MHGRHFEGSKILASLTLILLVCSFIMLSLHWQTSPVPLISRGIMLFWLFLAIIFCIVMFKEFIIGYLFCVFCMLIGWRISAMYDNYSMYPLLFAFIFLSANFIYSAYLNLSYPEKYLHALSLSDWQLVFIRLYLGFDFVPHFTEKLFAGVAPHMVDVNAFIQLGVPYPDFFVWLAGCCELGAAIALGLGFMMRIGALGTVIYLFIATYLGHHFDLGFIWANEGGGWEFATMWMILILSFAFTGWHAFSIDQYLEDQFKLPQFVKKLL